MRVGQRIAYAGLGGQVDYPVEALFAEKVGYALRIGDVELHESEIRIRRKLSKARCFRRTS